MKGCEPSALDRSDFGECQGRADCYVSTSYGAFRTCLANFSYL